MKKILIVGVFLVCSVLAQCPAPSLSPGNHLLTFRYDGLEREFRVHVPTRYTNNQPYALVFAFHGYTQSPQWMESESGFNDYSDETNNFIVVYPQGVGDSWNAGSCCGTAMWSQVDDYGFARALIAHMASLVCIDLKRVFTTGFSNGCFLSQGLICKAPDMFAASACGSGGVILLTDCNRDFNRFNATLNILEIHGTLDPLVPYNGNKYLNFPPVSENFQAHAARLTCASGPRQTFRRGKFSCQEYHNCSGGKVVEQCTVQRGTHHWFNDENFSNSEYILDFFGLRAIEKVIEPVDPADSVDIHLDELDPAEIKSAEFFKL